MTPSPPPHPTLGQLLDAQLQTLSTPHRFYRAAAHRFLAYLQSEFPPLLQLSDLRRDPHLLGWLRGLGQQHPPLSTSTRRLYLVGLRRLFQDLAGQGHPLPPGLILSQDFPPQPPRPPKLRRPNPGPLPLLHPLFGELFDTHLQTLTTTLRPQALSTCRAAARRFLAYLQSEFPDLRGLSELRRDPHLLGWLRGLAQLDPPVSQRRRQTYWRTLRHLLHQLAAAGHPLPPGLFLPQDFPGRTPLPLSYLRFGDLLDLRVQTLATTLRPGTTRRYRGVARHFLAYLQSEFPDLSALSHLRRDPHLLGWFRRLCQHHPPLSNGTRHQYLLDLRRLLYELASAGHPLPPALILPEDFPPQPHYLPRALSPDDDRQLQQELSRTNDLLSNALLLTRATGIRIGECIHLAFDCLRSLGQNQWALHVPLGKLYTERLVPVDDHVRHLVTRIVTLRAEAPASHLARSASFLLPRSSGCSLYQMLRLALQQAAGRAHCSAPITCHQLRHSYASEMIRLGVSLPALMQLLGHTNIRMTMRYVQVTQQDLQREFHRARHNALHPHHLPQLPVSTPLSPSPDLPGIRRALAATRRLLEMYRRQLQEEKARRKLQRLDKRLLTVAWELDRFATPEK
jgi:site-specific recombinase XerD